METVTAVEGVRARLRAERAAGRRVGFVPTMGALHAGHLSLIAQARARAARVVMSVFVNPLQFGPAEDFARYPRDAAGDREKAVSAGVDLLWMPTTEEMYPEPPAVTVLPGSAGERLEGTVRPGHFAGVLTVVMKLFAVVQPDVAVFGRKDFQQAALIKRMVRDLNLPVEIVVAPTMRERDGLALSSRNAYLGAAARPRATALFRALEGGVALYRAGERRPDAIVAAARQVLEAEGGLEVEYVACVDAARLEDQREVGTDAVLLVAARLGETRLIDNVVLAEGLEGDGRVA
jgi:pantoate--beta-alanine ligase